MIYLGTSGFSFEDWIGPVYPPSIKKSQMLTYYWSVLGFNTVELNFTYYSMPSYKTVVSMLRKTPPDFMFSVKLPGHVTHEGWRKGLDVSVVEDYKNAIKPMEEEGRLLSHLAQFPYAFKFSEEGLKYLKRLGDQVRPLAVEFRHRSWDRKETYDFLRENGLTYVIVDEPQIADLFPYKPFATSDTAYFRFHGRNEKWFEEGAERYDYLYSDEDLKRFALDVKEMSKKVGKVLVYFNNCHRGQAVENALKTKEILGL